MLRDKESYQLLICELCLACRSQSVRFVQGDLYIVRYRAIRALLHEGGVKLI